MISEQAKRKACELASEILPIGQCPRQFDAPAFEHTAEGAALTALARVLQEHSDVAKAFGKEQMPKPPANEPEPLGWWYRGYCAAILELDPVLQSLILPDEPDGLELAWKAARGDCGVFLAELHKNGLQIVPKDKPWLT